jgi:hypothetical protein
MFNPRPMARVQQRRRVVGRVAIFVGLGMPALGCFGSIDPVVSPSGDGGVFVCGESVSGNNVRCYSATDYCSIKAYEGGAGPRRQCMPTPIECRDAGNNACTCVEEAGAPGGSCSATSGELTVTYSRP